MEYKTKRKQTKKQNKNIDTDNRLVVTRGKGGQALGKGGKGGKIYGDRWKIDFSGKHTRVYTDIEIQCCISETYIVLYTCYLNRKLNKQTNELCRKIFVLPCLPMFRVLLISPNFVCFP